MDRISRIPARGTALALLLIFVLSMALAACGGSDNADDFTGEEDSDGALAFAASDEDESEVAPAMGESSAREAIDGDLTDTPAGQIAYERLVIRTAQITLTVEDTISATASVRNLATTKGGFVFASTTYTEQDRQFAQLTLRVPAEQFDNTISELRAAPWVTEVTREESSSQDVSAEYVDNESRLTALEETQRRYLSLLTDADTIESILRLESELTSVRSQIETIKGRQAYLSEMTAFSTVTVTLRPVDAEEEEEESDNGFALTRIFQDAWDRSSGALTGLAEATIVVAIFVLFVAPFALLAWIAYRFTRRTLDRQARDASSQSPVD